MKATESLQVHIVSHTHWDREWYLTYEQFRLRLVGLIDRLLDMMESQPDYEYFHLDGQTIVLEDYLELRPHQEPRLRALIAQGRILIGPWYDMPDEFLVSGESLIRNLARGHRISRRFGTPMPVGYLPDLFGHVGQMPQILRNFGLDNAILWRGFGGRQAEYWWESPDGSRVLMMHLPSEGYCNATRVHLDPEAMIDRTALAIRNETARTAVGQVLLMNGVDHVEPHPIIPALARQLAEHLGVSVTHSTLPAYVDAVRSAVAEADAGKSLEVITGELRGGEDYANLLPGVFSARVYIKQANARVQTLLEKRAEPLATFASMLGAAYPGDELRYAWKTLLQNHPHDSICGCSIDAVHEENMTRFARAEQVTQAVVDQSADVIARAVPAGPPGTLRLVAVNTTAEPVRGVIEAYVDVPYESDEPRRLVDPGALDAPVRFWPKDARIEGIATHDGQPAPFQVLSVEASRPVVMSRYETPWILRGQRHHILWMGHVPTCGYSTFDAVFATTSVPPGDLRPSGRPPSLRATSVPPSAGGGFLGLQDTPREEEGANATAADVRVEGRTAENALVRIAINDDGTVEVEDKRSGVRYERCGTIEDIGDVGDEYNYSPPATDRRFTSADLTDVRITAGDDGPLRASFRIDGNLALPAAITPDRSRRTDEAITNAVSIIVTLDAGSPRVDWRIVIDNRSADHRLRVLFPTGVDEITEVRAETAFGVARRPARRERPEHVRMEVPVSYGPTSSFTEAGSDSAGAMLFGEGLSEYEAVPGDDGRVSALALTLLRCVGYLSREDLVLRPSGHAGPGLATPGAQCPGRHEFHLAFEPRGDAPSHGALFRRAASFVSPPLVTPAIGTGGQEPPMATFLQIEARPGDVVLSACHRADEHDGIIVRMFNADAATAMVRVTPKTPLNAAAVVDFLERDRTSLNVVNGGVAAQVPPYGIVTLRMT